MHLPLEEGKAGIGEYCDGENYFPNIPSFLGPRDSESSKVTLRRGLVNELNADFCFHGKGYNEN